jgi:hypothetical protein
VRNKKAGSNDEDGLNSKEPCLNNHDYDMRDRRVLSLMLKPVRENYHVIIVGTWAQNTVLPETEAACRRIEQWLQHLGCDRDYLRTMKRERLCEW